MSTLSATNDAEAGSLFQSVVQGTGLDVSNLGQLAQVQLAVAEIFSNAPPGSVAAADIASGTFGANIPDTGNYAFPATMTCVTMLATGVGSHKFGSNAGVSLTVAFNGAVGQRSLQWETAGSGRWIMRCNSTAESGSDAGSNFELLARTDTNGTIDTPFAIVRAAGGNMTITRPIALGARLTITQATGNTAVIASTGYSLTGSSAVGMVSYAGTWNTSGTPTALAVAITNTASNAASLLLNLVAGAGGATSMFSVGVTGITTVAGALTVNAACQLGTAAGADLITIGGTGYGAGVASVRLNGLSTAAVSDQTGTLTNAPSAGNPVFWIPVSIAGTVRYIPAWA